MYKINILVKTILLVLTLFFMNLGIHPGFAQDGNNSDNPYERFGNFSENSELTINHAVWDTVLQATVVVVRMSSRPRPKTRQAPSTGSKLSRGSRAPAPIEGNRVQFHLLNSGHLALVNQYRQDLENLPNTFPLASFSQDEQLAFWLNLHNAVLFEQLAKRYPKTKIKNLRQSKKGQASLWDEKLVTVDGISMSLTDIQNNILIRHWKSPMVLYGLYQGAVGGPSISNQAFTGENVHDLLDQTAQKFVSSERAIKVRGGDVKISMIYDWGKEAFPNWRTNLSDHLAKIVKSSMSSKVAKAQSFRAGLYDWDIADTKKGKLTPGVKGIPSAANMREEAKSQCDADPCPAGTTGGGN